MKNKIIITGAAGLIGSEAVKFYAKKGWNVYGIDNNMRKTFFGEKGSVEKNIKNLIAKFKNFKHFNVNIVNQFKIEELFEQIKPNAIIHCAAQPSHDKAASIPILDFEVNARGTINLLEATRKHCNSASFVHVSTNKVYGDAPNNLNLIEKEKRYDFADELYSFGIDEKFTIDQSKHSLFGASKLSADIIAQEYGRYFNMNVGVFRGGCLTGPQHAGVELHGFLSYIVKCALSNSHYTIFGYKGKQVRDQIHCADVVSAFDCFIQEPRQGEVYNIGGGKENSASILEVIDMIEDVTGKTLSYTYSDTHREGDHICYYSDMRKFKNHYPAWKKMYNLERIIKEMVSYE